MQEPSRVERLLHAYILRTGGLPDDAYQIRNTSELPEILRTVLARAIEQGEVWSCWAGGSRLWLFTCHMSLPLSRQHGAPVIEVHRYREDAELEDSGIWRYDAKGTWTRCTD